jgi:diguanylate cyclase (GGDEF)-like protein
MEPAIAAPAPVAGAASSGALPETRVPGRLAGRPPRTLALTVAGAYFGASLLLLAFGLFSINAGSAQRARQDMRELALALASQVDVAAHARMREPAQTGSPAYLALIEPLVRMHGVLEGVRNVYTLRATPAGYEYVLDTAHAPALRPLATSQVAIGDLVDAASLDARMSAVVARGRVFVDSESYVEGGVALRGVYAPLRDADGRLEAVLGIDYDEAYFAHVTGWWMLGIAAPVLLVVGLVALFIGAVVYVLRRDLGRVLEERRLESIRDGLTGLYNRRHFSARLASHVERARRDGVPLALMVFDVDHFKRVNDELGHPAGDAVLCAIAQQVQLCTRAEDLGCRIGGEEFAVIMPGTTLEQARAVFARLSEAIRRPLDCAGSEVRATVSAGIAALDTGTVSAPALLARADQALYVAKESGRDWCVVAAPSAGARGTA